jgi:NAD(P)-dependent dehydrogenase (short-subunit alcohol dehydrogenase family)
MESIVLTLVTGVSKKGQVGEAVASAFAARGDTVILVARHEADVRERAAEIPGASAYVCDLADPAAVDRLARDVRSAHGGRLDALVHTAGGFGMSGPLSSADPAVLQQQLSINLVTAFLVTRAFFDSVRSARGSIVFFASESVLEGARTARMSAYAAAKSAVVGLMRSVADEGRADGVRANAVAPGTIRTATNVEAMGGDQRYVEREDVASSVLFLCSEAARAVSGQVIRLR